MTCRDLALFSLLGLLAFGCCNDLSGARKIATAVDAGAAYVLDGGSLDGKAAGLAGGSWDHGACVQAEKMRELFEAIRDVGVPAISAMSEGKSFAVPDRAPVDHNARCLELAPQ